jgi:hypothetical protein
MLRPKPGVVPTKGGEAVDRGKARSKEEATKKGHCNQRHNMGLKCDYPPCVPTIHFVPKLTYDAALSRNTTPGDSVRWTAPRTQQP